MAAATEARRVGVKLPPGTPAPRRGPAPVYLPILEDIKARVSAGEGEGEWWLVRKYTDVRGADKALYRLTNDKIAVPAGKWEFESRKTPKGSKLFAKFHPRKVARGVGTAGKKSKSEGGAD